MIGKLTGTIDSIDGSHLVIDVQGVGYVVQCSPRTLRQLGGAGSAAALLVETLVREDAISLYGFADALERDWFRLLTTVQGVGARIAQAILGSMSPEQLAQAITAQDKTALTAADGVGPKLAARLITELKDKVVGSFAVSATGGIASHNQDANSAPNNSAGEALSALINLGYRRSEAFAAVTVIAQKLGANAPLDQLIRQSLTELSRKDSAA